MKKVVSVILALVLTFGLMTVTASAKNDATVSLKADVAKAEVGDTITVTLSLDYTDECTYMLLTPSYDTNSLELVDAYQHDDDRGTVTIGANVLYEPHVNSRTKVIDYFGPFAVLEFKVLEGARPGNTTITLTVAEAYNEGEDEAGNLITESTNMTINPAVVKLDVPCNHVWDNGTVTTAPKCTEKGVKTFTCTICGETKTEDIDALGHDMGGWIQTKEPKCTEKGEETNSCSRCDYKETREVEALGHKPAADAVTVPATCTEPGSITGKCERCGETLQSEVIPALGHDWGDWTETKAATCEEKGEETHACKREGCDAKETREVEALGHDWNEKGTVTKEPTCTEKGEMTYTCKRDEKHTKTEEIDALGHDWNEPTYTWSEKNDKVTAERICKRDAEHKETEEVKPTEKVTKQPTAFDKGESELTATFTNEAFAKQTKTVETDPVDLKITDETKGRASWGTDYKMKVNAPKDSIDEVTVDGKTLSADYYTVKEEEDGTCTITVKGAYISKLKVGNHTFGVTAIKDGTTKNASVRVSVSDKVKTGDENSIGLWIALLTVSAIGAGAAVVIGKKKSNKA